MCDGIRRVSEEETVYLIITLIITLRLIPENLFSLSALTGRSVQQELKDADVGLKVKEKQVGE